MGQTNVLEIAACVVVSAFALVCVSMVIGIAVHLWREIREVSQWLDDLKKQRKSPKPDDHDDDEYEQDDYADIDPEADTVEFIPLPPDASQPKPRN